MKIIHYPHPTLRYKSKPVTVINRELKEIVREMFVLMYAAKGIGLAANQVGLPLQLFVINLAGNPDEGDERVFINPVISKPGGQSEAEEGCLSIPEVNGMVLRPEKVHVSAFDLAGNEIDETVDGLLARAIQHEHDHLNSILFIDRLSESVKKNIDGQLYEFENHHQALVKSGEIPDVETNIKQLAEIEAKFCV
ncbi:peptide deformylase [Mariniblastus fucicola]|uniref:Peptide deformylase n=1 Tax=Mariniblastus fucicola TaxID=980251 RepID=A0A5B9P1J8_9BACT|nr:peptide deformylase [Mariniblastus fucicola]QEG20188.1 Peptide deformylase [Mariniblastus fucicola]